jgi:pimeloyl-ACP methyl ester carboxylesterase
VTSARELDDLANENRGFTPGPLAIRLIDANGLTFEVHERCPREAPAPRRLALFLHGFPEHAHAWRHQLPVLAGLGYRAWAVNLRGYGRTSRPPRMRDYAIEHLLADVAALIDASGAEETVLIAHDWGAVIAWYFAIREIRPLARLVIMNVPHPGPAARELRTNPQQRRRSWYAFFFQLPVLPEKLLGRRNAEAIARIFAEGTVTPGRVAAEDAELFARNARQPGALKAMIDYYRALVRGGGARRQQALGFPAIRTPTLLIWGEQDVALTVATTFGTEQWVPDLRLRYLPEASHWVQQDAPEQVNAMLEAFVSGSPVPHSPGAEGDRDPD